MSLEKLPSTWNIRQKGKWIKDHFKEVDESVTEVGKAETARILGIYVGSLYNLYTRRNNPDYGNRVQGRPKKVIENVTLKVEKRIKTCMSRGRRGKSRSPVRAVDTLLRASKGDTFNNSLVQSVVTILEDYSKTKLELKSREEQVIILTGRIKELELELLRYRAVSSKENKDKFSEILTKAKSALVTYGD
jgi:hypothetical protein